METRALGGGTDQADKGARRTAERREGQAIVQPMIVGQDEDGGVIGRVGHALLDRRFGHDGNALDGFKDRAGVEPGEAEGQIGDVAGDGLPDMASAEQIERSAMLADNLRQTVARAWAVAARRQAGRQGLVVDIAVHPVGAEGRNEDAVVGRLFQPVHRGGIDMFDEQPYPSATTLAQQRSEWIILHPPLAWGKREDSARLFDRAIFKLPAADRATERVGGNQHPRPRPARRGALGRHDADQRTGLPAHIGA